MIVEFNGKDNIGREDERQIAMIVKEAFKEKLEWFYKGMDKSKMQLLIEKSITYNLGFYYVEDGEILGVTLLATKGKKYLSNRKEITKHMKLWNGVMYKLSFSDFGLKANELNLGMIAVCPNARGKGIGKKMLSHVYNTAIREQKDTITLDVINTNIDAKRLYEKEGFKESTYLSTHLFTKGMGFTGLSIMKKTLDRSSSAT